MHEYTIKTDAGETTVLLSDEEAKARGLKPNSSKAAHPANKQATPENKTSAAEKRDEAVSKAMNKPSKADG